MHADRYRINDERQQRDFHAKKKVNLSQRKGKKKKAVDQAASPVQWFFELNEKSTLYRL